MNANTFDTHAAVTALREAGLDEAPAVAIVSTVRDAASTDHADLATKADLADLKADPPGASWRGRNKSTGDAWTGAISGRGSRSGPDGTRIGLPPRGDPIRPRAAPAGPM